MCKQQFFTFEETPAGMTVNLQYKEPTFWFSMQYAGLIVNVSPF